ncbi:hypothetical protein F383_30502 [Gossypium arboreum]|uniref:Uncharacterized protein n=1 Tax=Gossypium arboreum TaxID=29729 RepID=A0A0B0PLN1_GOSAR|nr:hypothetical protein F383_30502 [Gossypium arboreum]
MKLHGSRSKPQNLIQLKLHWRISKLQGVYQKMQWIEPKLQDTVD